ncbi:MAG: acyltransferase [Ruminiclostridium sp.]|nr:acyltransferase [Ruminiclostridium sp.]
MADRANRQSNIELLRIIAACGVIILHYNNPKIGGGYAAVTDGSINQAIMTFFESLSICAVNLYVLISGYFMRGSMKRDFLKPVGLIAQLVVFELAFCLIKELPKGNSLDFRTVLGYFTPSYWFVFVYIALYLISPYINLVWTHLSDSGKKTLLLILAGLFSVYAIIPDIVQYYYQDDIYGASTIGLFGSQAGYTIVNFVLVYLIGCYLKDREDKGKKTGSGKLLLWLLLTVAAIMGLTYLEKTITGRDIFATTAYNYEHPLVIIESVLVFLLFRNINMAGNSVINKLAVASFPAYLIHMNLLEYCGIDRFVQENPALLTAHILGCTIVMYLISFVLYLIYDLVTKPLFAVIAKHWKKRTYSV